MNRIEDILSHYDIAGAEMIKAAYALAAEALKEMKRSDGVPFIEHPLGVAGIVSEEIGLASDSVIAVFLHEASRVNPALMESMRRDFPPDIVGIAEALNKISVIKPKDTRLEADKYRRLIVSYSKDPRVFLIKLADRLEVMRNLGRLPKLQAARKNVETMFLYIPLAYQTGVYNIKTEMENLWLKYAYPEQYRTIVNQLTATEKDREELVKEFVNPLKERLTAEGIRYTLKARTKSPYSIWKKMQVQNIPFSKVYDVFAIRFIIESPPELEKDLCWQVYSLVTEEYEPDTSRLRDWVTVPKPNGYQSIHTTVKNDRGNFIEVQIRTERMDYEAEMGMAAHWTYKGVKREASMGDWLQRVRAMMENPSSGDYGHLSESVRGDVFVFTPDGDLRQIHEGATVLDFAFEIHTNVGLKCIGGKIDGKMVPIREKLKTGDVVEIITGKNQKPSADWLDIVVTSKARNKIRQKLNEAENKLARDGRDILDRRLKNWKMNGLESDILNALVKRYDCKTMNEFYGMVGKGEIDMSDIKAFLLSGRTEEKGVEEKTTKMSPVAGQPGSDYLTVGEGRRLRGVDYKMAKCCNPVYGDDVFGFVTVNDGIKIHRMSCPNAARLLSYEHRVQKVRWREDVHTSGFQTRLRIVIDDESEADGIFPLVSGFSASVRQYELHNRASGNESEVVMTIMVSSASVLDKIMAALKKMRCVRQVTRL